MKNAITTEHKLDFMATVWHRDPGIMVFKVGTCHGQYVFSDQGLEIISIINDKPGNGHLNDVFQWFEYAARVQKLNLLIRAFMNNRFKKHCIKKRGFKAIPKTDDVIKVLTPTS
jgi:hypothetical protein